MSSPLRTEYVLASTHTRAMEALREAEKVIEWYGDQSRLARLIHSGGDPGRHAISEDGGKRAKAALTLIATAKGG